MGAGRAMNRRGPGKLRVIGGDWRSRVIEFDAANGVRPTPDRIRPTLFAWLAPPIYCPSCPHLVAGSGALGTAALPRGTASCCFVQEGARQHVVSGNVFSETGNLVGLRIHKKQKP